MQVNTISFNPFNEFLLATGSSNNLVELWDMRKMTKPLYELNSHWLVLKLPPYKETQ